MSELCPQGHGSWKVYLSLLKYISPCWKQIGFLLWNPTVVLYCRTILLNKNRIVFWFSDQFLLCKHTVPGHNMPLQWLIRSLNPPGKNKINQHHTSFASSVFICRLFTWTTATVLVVRTLKSELMLNAHTTHFLFSL